MTNRDREAACAAVAKFTASFTEDGAAVIPTSELRERLELGEEIVLVDVRHPDEQRVSMIPGAVSQEVFESEILPSLLAVASEPPLIVPYCTVGYRSGMYARTLMKEKGLKNVRNGEGVLMWTFDGCGLVKPQGGKMPGHAPKLPMGSLGAPGEAEAVPSEQVKEVHVYGATWNIAAEGYKTVMFSQAGGTLRAIQQSCSWQSWAPSYLWFFSFMLFYLFLTPACGVMYGCGCLPGASKKHMVAPCNIYKVNATDPEGVQPCPWCSCSGLPCIFVGSDTKAFRGIFLLDVLPDGFFITLFMVLAVSKAWARLDHLANKDKQLPKDANGYSPVNVSGVWFVAKAAFSLAWFLCYSVIFGALFYATSPKYPYFLGASREE
eukprot:gnl/MRDRNA2_/MRDRNA2_62031_c0_seq1.p1 gnl/MRDRNA2_/MRDRNA2_62031_c0~~gnl/MRDRNA2_/MRDRNA2_62031_c0_seq1.p1  ORF type:complete len:378 (+),score=50.11 gnl/MRDRNA2_/MRDRNA2_62031_c0_seq1:85-1218(+)